MHNQQIKIQTDFQVKQTNKKPYYFLDITHVWALKASTATPTPKLACFVLYLKIINTFLKNNTYIL